MKKVKLLQSCLLVLVLFSVFTFSANAVEARKSTGYKWKNKSATVYFYCGFNSVWKDALSASMTSWNNVKNVNNETIVPMAFTNNSSHSNKIYSSSGQTWLAKALPTVVGEYFDSVSIAFNSGDYTFSVGAVSGKFDIQSVATHELGHAIGIAHCHEKTESSCFIGTCPTNVMNPLIQANMTRRVLTAYDTSSKKVIYP